MKKGLILITTAALVVIMLFAAAIASHASDADLQVGAAADVGAQEESGSISELLTGRISEMTEPENVVRAVTWASSVASVLIITLLRASLIKLRNKISGTLENTAEKTNELVECYNESNRRIDRLENTLGSLSDTAMSKNSRESETYEAVCAFADMLFTVYNGSTTIPEGMKDLLREKYAGLLKSAKGEGDKI